MVTVAWARAVSAYLTLPLSDRLECTRDLNGRWGGRNSGYKKLSEFACLKNNRTTAREENIKLALGNGGDNLNQYIDIYWVSAIVYPTFKSC